MRRLKRMDLVRMTGHALNPFFEVAIWKKPSRIRGRHNRSKESSIHIKE